VAFAPIMSGVAVAFAAEHPRMTSALVLIDGGPGLRPDVLPNVRARLASIPVQFDTWDAAAGYLRGSLAPAARALADDRAPYVFRRLLAGRVEWKYDPVLREDFLRD